MVSLADIQISRTYETESDPGDDLSYLSMESVFTAPEIGRDERRMQVRAYNHWLAQTVGGELPAIEELRPEELDDLGPSGVLVDLTLGVSRPAIIFLGEALAAECGDEREIFGLGDVPRRSLLSRLTEHCLEVVANRAPVGFDAEFMDRRGQTILYRSMLLPYSSDGAAVDFVFGVISWKEGATAATPVLPAPAAESAATPTLTELLAAARDLAKVAVRLEDRSHKALYAAVSGLHDFALVARRDRTGIEALLRDARLNWQERAPLVALARLAFGPAWPKARLSEIALVLAHAQRLGTGFNALEAALLTAPGGLKGMVAAERAMRRGNVVRDRVLRPAVACRTRALKPAALDTITADVEEFSLLVARRNSDGTLSLLGNPGDVRLLETAAKRLLAA